MTSAQQKKELSLSTINHFEMTLQMLNESMGMCFPTILNMTHDNSQFGANDGPEQKDL